MPRSKSTALTVAGGGRTVVRKKVEVTVAGAFPNPTTVKEVKLLCADVVANNNKFYHLKVESSPSAGYRLWSNYGRVGAAGRTEMEPFSSQYAAEAAFDKVVASKTRVKKNGKAEYSIVKTLDTTTNALALPSSSLGIVKDRFNNVLSKSAPAGAVLGQQAFQSGLRAPLTWAPNAQRFFNDLLRETTCLVEAGMQVSTFTQTATGTVGLNTPLGIIGKDEIQRAQVILAAIGKAIIDKADHVLRSLNSQFFRIVPTPVGGTHTKLADNMIDTLAKVDDKSRLLDAALDVIAQQEQASQAAQMGAATNMPARDLFPVLLEEVDAAERTMLTALLRKEQCGCHPEVKTLAPVEAFRVTRPSEVAKFRASYPNRMTLFHGTRRETAAGILTRGFLPTDAARASGGSYSGSVYGDGIYFASNAGKSLGYTGGAGKGRRTMFVSFVAMGKAFLHDGRAGWGFKRPAGMDSVWAKGTSGLAHDEMIVPIPEQTCIAYLLTL